MGCFRLFTVQSPLDVKINLMFGLWLENASKLYEFNKNFVCHHEWILSSQYLLDVTLSNDELFDIS